MKIKNKISILAVALGVVTMTSCNDWFDARSESEIYAEEHFADQSGFADQLTGAYTKMISQSLYGMNSTFGFMEVLSQNYDLHSSNSTYVTAAEYNYEDASVKPIIEELWNTSYNVIANLNLMLDYIDNGTKFDDGNYEMYKGAALGLRAFLHFDLMRQFAPMPKDEPNTLSIPYVTEYTTKVTKQSTVAENMINIKNDLFQAMDLLQADPIYKATSDSSWYVRDEAAIRFNYYAALATLARVYQWEGNIDSARICAEQVITDDKFNWVHYTSATTNQEYERDLLYQDEHIFRLYFYDMKKIATNYFHSYSGSENPYMFSPSETKIDNIYEVTSAALGGDYRNLYWYRYDGSIKCMSKFWQPEGGRYLNQMPLIRLSEMYYIAAESYAASDPNYSAKLLNEVRENRGYGSATMPILDTLNATTEYITNELYKEMRKELIGEGQLFYYYKRNGYTTIPGSAVTADRNVYVFDMPENEIEFGDRK